MYSQLDYAPHEKGVGLIVVILVLSFMMSIGLVLITTTSTGPEVAGNIRDQQQAFDAAEAGFDTTWLTIDGYFTEGGWTSFDTHYLQEPSGIDLPLQQNYFRRKTNEELLDLIGDFEAGRLMLIYYFINRCLFLYQEAGLIPGSPTQLF